MCIYIYIYIYIHVDITCIALIDVSPRTVVAVAAGVGVGVAAGVAVLGWHYLSKATCPILPDLSFGRFFVSGITIICYMIRRTSEVNLRETSSVLQSGVHKGGLVKGGLAIYVLLSCLYC